MLWSPGDDRRCEPVLGCGKAHPDAMGCKGAVFGVQPAVVPQFLGSSFLRKLQAATPRVLLLFMLKVSGFTSFLLQFVANDAGQQHMPSTRKCITNTRLARSS